MNAHDPSRWILNWHFGAFRTIWVHSGPFVCPTKLGAKRAELVRKFVPRSHVRIFSNKCTRSVPSDPKLTFCCISYYLCALGTVWLAYETRCETGRTSAKCRAMKSCRNFPQRTTQSTPLDPNLMFQSVLYYLGAFGIVWFRYNTQYKMGQIFSN